MLLARDDSASLLDMEGGECGEQPDGAIIEALKDVSIIVTRVFPRDIYLRLYDKCTKSSLLR